MFRATYRPSSGAQKLLLQRPTTKKYVKPEAAIAVFELLMVGGVSSEKC
jgi:hypothetical protein